MKEERDYYEGLRHVNYTIDELHLLKETVKPLEIGISNTYFISDIITPDVKVADIRTRNASIEAWVIFFRSLYDFFYGEKDYKNYIRANQFFEDSQDWSVKLNPPTELMKKSLHKTHPKTAHLSWDRLKKETRDWEWEVEILTKELNNNYKILLECFSDETINTKLSGGIIFEDVENTTFRICRVSNLQIQSGTMPKCYPFIDINIKK